MAVATRHETDEAVAPKWHAKAPVIQKFGSVIEDMPHYLDAKVRGRMCEMLNVLLADSIASSPNRPARPSRRPVDAAIEDAFEFRRIYGNQVIA